MTRVQGPPGESHRMKGRVLHGLVACGAGMETLKEEGKKGKKRERRERCEPEEGRKKRYIPTEWIEWIEAVRQMGRKEKREAGESELKGSGGRVQE